MRHSLISTITIGVFIFIGVLQTDAQSRDFLDSLNQQANSLKCIEVAKSDSISNYVIQKAKQKKYPLLMAYALKNISSNQICTGEFKDAISNLKQAVSLFKDNSDQKGIAESYNNLASAYMRLSKLDTAKMYNKLQLKMALDIGDSVLLASGYQIKSGIHSMLSENDSIVVYALKGLKIAERIGNKELEANLVILVGSAYYQNEDNEEALDYFLKARRIMVKSNSLKNLNIILYNIATCYSKLRVLDSAFIYYEKVITANKAHGNKFILAYAYQGIADAYHNDGQYDKAIEYNLLSRDLSLEMNEKKSLATVLSNLSSCYLKINNSKLAIDFAKQAIVIDTEIGDLDKTADAYWLLSQAYLSEGNHKLSLESFKKFYSIDSTILNREKSKTMFELETKYNTEKKDLEISSLSQQASIKDLEIQQKNQVILIAIITLLLIAGIIYFIYRQHTFKNQQSRTELEQRFLRSQLNPHFISNALMAVQNFMLKNEPEKASTYLAKFSKLMREILENSRQEFIPVEDEIQMLTNYLEIHRLRMNDSFNYKIELDESIDVEMDTIPPMFVQPFIENAIEHGIINAKGKGMINLNLIKEGDYISIVISDNGGGIVNSSVKSIEHNSLSTTIIQERMALFNKSLKKKIQLVWEDIKTENGEIGGTKVELKVPFSYI